MVVTSDGQTEQQREREVRRFLHVCRQVKQQRPERGDDQDRCRRHPGGSAASPGKRRRQRNDHDVHQERRIRSPAERPGQRTMEGRKHWSMGTESRKARARRLFVDHDISAAEARLGEYRRLVPVDHLVGPDRHEPPRSGSEDDRHERDDERGRKKGDQRALPDRRGSRRSVNVGQQVRPPRPFGASRYSSGRTPSHVSATATGRTVSRISRTSSEPEASAWQRIRSHSPGVGLAPWSKR